jgi:hypothetical protein
VILAVLLTDRIRRRKSRVLAITRNPKSDETLNPK